jgi:predicted membrane channel-forming protein YqfA (hemolysin III family)
MKNRRGRLQLGIIWGLVVGLAALQVALLRLAGSGSDTAAVVYLVAGWVVVLSLAVLASRGIGTLTERLAARETAHRATLD